jgi:folate/biopterin transporter
VALSDVIVDSIVVERARQESLSQSGSLQSLTWGISAVGGVLTAHLSGWLLAHFSTRAVFEMTAIFPLVVVAIASLIVEEPVDPSSQDSATSQGTQQQLRLLGQAIRQKAILLPTLFVFLWQATPSADSAFFYFTTNELGFEPEFLGRVRLVTSLAALIGIWVYQRFLKSVPFRPILGWSIVISAILGMTTLLLVTHTNRALGIDDRWFSLGDSLILTVMGQIAFMPVLVLAARLCPSGIEASLFALLMSIWNLSGLVSAELGALLTHWLGITENKFDNLWLLVVITNLSTLFPLGLLGWLPQGDPQAESSASHPPVELYERRTPGTLGDTNILPELMPEWITTSEAIAPQPSQD